MKTCVIKFATNKQAAKAGARVLKKYWTVFKMLAEK